MIPLGSAQLVHSGSSNAFKINGHLSIKSKLQSSETNKTTTAAISLHKKDSVVLLVVLLQNRFGGKDDSPPRWLLEVAATHCPSESLVHRREQGPSQQPLGKQIDFNQNVANSARSDPLTPTREMLIGAGRKGLVLNMRIRRRLARLPLHLSFLRESYEVFSGTDNRAISLKEVALSPSSVSTIMNRQRPQISS